MLTFEQYKYSNNILHTNYIYVRSTTHSRFFAVVLQNMKIACSSRIKQNVTAVVWEFLWRFAMHRAPVFAWRRLLDEKRHRCMATDKAGSFERKERKKSSLLFQRSSCREKERGRCENREQTRGMREASSGDISTQHRFLFSLFIVRFLTRVCRVSPRFTDYSYIHTISKQYVYHSVNICGMSGALERWGPYPGLSQRLEEWARRTSAIDSVLYWIILTQPCLSRDFAR